MKRSKVKVTCPLKSSLAEKANILYELLHTKIKVDGRWKKILTKKDIKKFLDSWDPI